MMSRLLLKSGMARHTEVMSLATDDQQGMEAHIHVLLSDQNVQQ